MALSSNYSLVRPEIFFNNLAKLLGHWVLTAVTETAKVRVGRS